MNNYLYNPWPINTPSVLQGNQLYNQYNLPVDFSTALHMDNLSNPWQPNDSTNNTLEVVHRGQDFGEMSGWGKLQAGIGMGKDILGIASGGFSLFDNITSYGNRRALLKEQLASARLNNQALREDMQFKRDEIARLGQMRSNAKKQQMSGQISTRG